MERVKYYIPDIEVKCTTSYCRQGEIVKMCELFNSRACIKARE